MAVMVGPIVEGADTCLTRAATRVRPRPRPASPGPAEWSAALPAGRRPSEWWKVDAVRYLISVIDDATGSATPDEVAAIDAFNERLQTGGHWVLACGLAEPGTASVIDNRGSSLVVSDGPLVRSAEYVSGFWVVEAADLDAARVLAAEGSRCCGRKVELRPFFGAQ